MEPVAAHVHPWAVLSRAGEASPPRGGGEASLGVGDGALRHLGKTQDCVRLAGTGQAVLLLISGKVAQKCQPAE